MTIKKEFIYIFVIMLLGFGIITICTIMFYDSKNAVLGISVASTLISIVLAVLAIAYTFVDSSAQKNNIAEMKATADKLAASVEQENQIISQFAAQLESVSSLKDELISKIADTEEWRKEVIERLKEVTVKDGQETDQKVLSEISNILDEEVINFSKRYNKRISGLQKIQIAEFIILSLIQLDEPIHFNDLFSKVMDEYPVRFDEVKSILNELVKNNKIYYSEDKYMSRSYYHNKYFIPQ